MYRMREWLLSDVVPGVSTGLVAVLQGTSQPSHINIQRRFHVEFVFALQERFPHYLRQIGLNSTRALKIHLHLIQSYGQKYFICRNAIIIVKLLLVLYLSSVLPVFSLILGMFMCSFHTESGKVCMHSVTFPLAV